MAEPEWILLFHKPRVYSTELDSLQIKSPNLSDVPPGFLGCFENICVVFGEHKYNECDLKCYQEEPLGFAFELWLSEEFEDPGRVQLKEDRQLSVYFRWVDDVVELKLDQGVTPEIPAGHNIPWTFLAYKQRVSDQDLRNAILSLSQHNIRTFYNNSPPHVKRLIQREEWFNLEAYSPGEFDSFDSQMRVQKGPGTSLEDSTILVDIREATPDTLNPWESVQVFYCYKRGKLEVRFVTPEYPRLPNLFPT